MKIKQLVALSHLVSGQYITVRQYRPGMVPVEYSTQGIGRYDFGPKNQDYVLALKVNSFRPTEYGIHIDAE